MTAASSKSRWELFPHFVLRRAGFPFDLVDELSLSVSAESLTALVDIEAKIDAAIATWNTTVFPALLGRCKADPDRGQKKALDRTANAVRRRRLPRIEDWETVQGLAAPCGFAAMLDELAAALASRQEIADRFHAQFADDLGVARERLYATGRTASFREALDQLNADLKLDLADAAQPRNGKVRQQELVIFKYLQRFCTKNETNSFFGPVHYGRIEEASPCPVLAIDANWPQRGFRPTIFFSHWLVEDIARRIAYDSRLELVIPLVAKPSRRKRRGQPWPDRRLSTRDIAAHLGISVPAARERVAAEIASGRWQRSLVISPSVIHQLPALADDVRALKPETADEKAAVLEWRGHLDAFLHDAQKISEAADPDTRKALRIEIEQRYERLTGGVARRNAGRMFRTRRAVYEDGWIPAGVKLAAGAAEDLKSALVPILETGLLYTRVLTARLHAEASGVIRTWFGRDARTLPYDQFIAAWHQQSQRPHAIDTACKERLARLDQGIAAFDTLWASVLDSNNGDGAMRWPLERFTAQAEGLGVQMNGETDLLLVSPDILPLARAADDHGPSWVFGEVHHGATPDGWMMSFHPAAASVRAELRAAISRTSRATKSAPQLANLIMARQMKTAPQEYPGLRVEWSAKAAPDGDAPVLGVRDLTVRVNSNWEELDLIDPKNGGCIRFYPPAFGFDQQAFAPFEMFSLPILRLPKRVPAKFLSRRTYRNMVIARSEWWFEAAELQAIAAAPDLTAAVVEAHRLRSAANMPRHTFVRCADEPKPIYIDWLNPFAIELIQKLARSGGRLAFSEMLPDPQQLWLRGSGGRYTSELRFVMTGNA